jgi:serine/threonine protein kinase
VAKTKIPRLKPGDVVGGRYRIDGVVGRGGFGAVYRATQQDTGAAVALKVLMKNLTNSKVDAKRFKREAALVQKLRHPNVVQLLDFGTTDEGVSYIAFELLHGTSLSALLKTEGALPLYRAAQITRDILSALAAAHAMGIIHRDIKPGNVFLLEGTDEAKVLDFGIAKAVTGEEAAATQLTEAGQMIGTPHYMAPEQVRGTGVQPSTDVYAAGLLFAEMICGERLVKGGALIDIYMMHISNDPIPLPDEVASSPVGEVIRGAVSKIAEQRYATAHDMLAALDRAMPGLAEGAARPVSGGNDPNMTAPLTRDGLDEGYSSSISALSSLPSEPPQPMAAEGSEAEDAAETMLMDRPGRSGQQERLAQMIASVSSGVPSGEAPPAESNGRGGKSIDATLDMEDGPMSPFAKGAGPASPAQTQAMAPATYNPVASSASGEHAYTSGEHAYTSGEHAYTSGEHAYTSGEHGYSGAHRYTSAPPPAQRAKSAPSQVALLLIVVAVVATVAAGLLLWAPWEDAGRGPSRPASSELRLQSA